MYYLVVCKYAGNLIWFKSNQVYELGEVVLINIWDEEEQGIVIRVEQVQPLQWESEFMSYNKVIEHDDVKHHINALVDCFKEGIISRKEFSEIQEGFLKKHEIRLEADSGLEQIIKELLPTVLANYVKAPGDEDDKEFGFRKAMKEWECMLSHDCKQEEVAKFTRSHRGLKHDPIEETEAYQRVEWDVHRLVVAEIGSGRYMGYCYRYWSTKKTILREKYGIEWRSPGEMNPMVHFD